MLNINTEIPPTFTGFEGKIALKYAKSDSEKYAEGFKQQRFCLEI